MKEQLERIPQLSPGKFDSFGLGGTLGVSVSGDKTGGGGWRW